VPIELVCHGEARREGYTSAEGNFDLQIGWSQTAVGDASAMLPRAIGERDLADCDLRASLAGFRSDSVSLADHRVMDSPNVGAIILHRLTTAKGFTISATSARAPKNARRAYEKGLTDVRKNRLDQAAKEFTKAVESYPKYALAWFELGKVHEQCEQVEDARTAYAQALAADPTYIGPYQRLSILAVKEAKWLELAGATGSIIRLNPKDFPAAYFFNAVANLQLGKLDAAEKSGRQALKLDPAHRNPRASYLLGLVLAQERVFRESAEYLRTFLNTLPKGPYAEVVQKQLDWVESLANAKPDPEGAKRLPVMGFH
jgi:tetratricopeptide (TPR) repeat protein